MNRRILSSKTISEQYDLDHIDITTAKSLKDVQRFGLYKIHLFSTQFFGLLSLLRKKKIDIVYITLSTEGLALYKDAFLWFIAALFVKKRVLHFHSKGIITTNRHSRFKMDLIKLIFSRSFVIVLSEFLRKEIAEYAKDIFILNYGIPNEVSPLGPDPFRPYPKTPTCSLKLLFLSNLSVEKGILQFLDVCDLLAQRNISFKATIAGKEWDMTVEMIRSEIQNRNLGTLVDVAGPVYGEDKINLLHQSDILLFPTYYKREAFPLVILEAFQFGIVPVCSDHAAIPEIIDQGVDGFCFPYDDVHSFAGCIEALANDPSRLLLMKNRSRIKYERRFTFEKYEEGIADILNKIYDRP